MKRTRTSEATAKQAVVLTENKQSAANCCS